MKKFFAYAIVFALLSTLRFQASADWPQWRGSDRNGHSDAKGLLTGWPDSGPKLAWSASDLGTGYSSVSVVGDHVYTMGSRDGKSLVICLSLSDGSTVWETPIGAAGKDGDYNVGWGAGQRSTPTVDGDQIFAISDLGTVAALDKQTGKVQWSIEMVGDFGGSVPTWGYSASALIDGDRVVVTPGGENFMIALDRQTGKQVWGSKGAKASAEYVSAMKGSIGDKEFYVIASKPGLMAFDVQSGEKLFENSATGNRVAVIPTPILTGNQIYHTSAYGAGNTLLDLSASGKGIDAKSVYALNTKSMENHHGGVVLVDGVIYGFTKQSGGNWMAQDLATGETLWMEKVRPNRSGSICYADGMLYCYNDKDGTVLLVKPSRDKFESTGKLTLPKETSIERKGGAIWAHPVVAHGKLIIRDQDLMYAFDVSAK